MAADHSSASPARRYRFRARLVLTLTALALIAAPAASAALAPPRPLSPDGNTSVQALPAFAWAPVPGADRYEFQIAADAGFNSPVLGRGDDRFFTKNTRATLKKTVPNGRYFWRVRAVTSGGDVSAWSAGQSLRKAWTGAAALQSPSNAETVVYPNSPLKLTWSPVLGAAKYLVSIATDPSLGSLVERDVTVNGPVPTAATAFTRAAALAPGVYYWAITPVDAQGNRGASSPVASFTWAWPSTTTARVVDLNDAAEVFDPQFSWDAVPGAARYEVEVNPSQDFAPGSKVCCSPATIATSLAPTGLFEDNVFYWRVRAIDVDGNAGLWNVGPSFTKTFDKVPPVTGTSIKNVRMRDNLNDPGLDVDAGTPGYQTQVPMVTWDPVPGASSYEAEVTPYTSGLCNWTATASHWRVKTAVNAWTPLGYDWNFEKPYNDQMNVAYDQPALVPGTSYCVRVRARSDRAGAMNEVYGDYTYLDGGFGWAFTWTGYPTGGACSPSCLPNYLGSGDYVLPVTGTTTARMPFFTWKPLSGKQSYFVLVSKDASFSNLVDYAFTQVPAYAPRTQLGPTTYSDETTLYYWAVLPANGFRGQEASGDPLAAAARTFQKQSTPPSHLFPSNGTVFTGQPSFRWTPAEGARRYRLQVAQDPSFGNPIEDVTTNSTAYTSNSTYPADTVLYWRVRADDENLVGLTWSATGTFQKKLVAPTPSADNPTGGDFIPTWTWNSVQGAVSYDVSVDLPDGTHKDINGLRMTALTAIKMTGTGLFSWRVRANFPKASFGTVAGPFSATKTFTRTIGEPGRPRSDGSPTHLLLSWDAKPGAKHYRVQVSQRPDFAYVIDDVTTDNTSFAPLLTSPQYTAGGRLYWRVAAVDEERNVGDFTQAQPISLLPRLRMSVAGHVTRRRAASVSVFVTSAAGRPVGGTRVAVSGAGVRGRVVTTGRAGRVTFRLRATRRGTLLFRASKRGYQTVTVAVRVR